MPAKKTGSVPAPTSPGEITLNHDQAKLLSEVFDRLKPNDVLTQSDWSAIAMKIGATTAKAAKERFRYVKKVLENKPTKASRAKPGQIVKPTITPSVKASTKSRPVAPAQQRPQTSGGLVSPKKRKTTGMMQTTLDAGPASKRSKTSVTSPVTRAGVQKIEQAQYDTNGGEDDEETEPELPSPDFAQLVVQRQIPVENEVFTYPSRSLPPPQMHEPTLDFSSLGNYDGGWDEEQDYDVSAFDNFMVR